MLHRALIEIGHHFGLPTVPHRRPHSREVGRRQHEQHVEHLGRADVDGKPHDELIVARIAPKREVRHHEVLVDEKLERLGFAQRQPQPPGGVLGNPQPHVAVVLDEAFAQVVNQ